MVSGSVPRPHQWLRWIPAVIWGFLSCAHLCEPVNLSIHLKAQNLLISTSCEKSRYLWFELQRKVEGLILFYFLISPALSETLAQLTASGHRTNNFEWLTEKSLYVNYP